MVGTPNKNYANNFFFFAKNVGHSFLIFIMVISTVISKLIIAGFLVINFGSHFMGRKILGFETLSQVPLDC